MNWRTYQAQQRVTRLGDRFLSYIDRTDESAGAASQADPVVLLHGIPTWGYLWKGLIPEVAAQRRTLVPDLLGFGFSDQRDCFDRSIDRQAAAIDRWLDQLGIESAAIVAHDIGGGVALRLATLYPERVSQLCVMNTVCYDSWPIELMLQFGHPSANRLVSASKTIGGLALALKSGFAKSPDSDFLEALLAPYRTEVGKRSLVRNAAALNTNQTTEISHLLPSIDVPTLVLWGEDDKFQDIRFGRRLATDIPNAEFVPLSDARHFVMVDRPDEVAKRVSEFLSAGVLNR